MLKFHDDPMANECEIVIYLGYVWWYTRKDRILGEEEKKTKLRERKSIVSVKTDLTLCIVRVLTTYHLLYLFIFIVL